MTIVVIVSEYDGPEDEALREITDTQTRYEGFSHVYVADSLDSLPHPMQIEAIREHFGDSDSNYMELSIPDYGKYTVRKDMPAVQQIEMWQDVASDHNLTPAQIDRGTELLTALLLRSVS